MQTPSGSDRLSTALGALGRASGRFDVRATLAVTMTLATIAMILAVEDIPDAWWLAWGSVITFFFPRPVPPAEPPR